MAQRESQKEAQKEAQKIMGRNLKVVAAWVNVSLTYGTQNACDSVSAIGGGLGPEAGAWACSACTPGTYTSSTG